ncbi:MAG: hypothetical protein HGB31_06780 [Erysipelotrichaceae bacterium]|nr:hypothetical protein [Erysipelotrichaceae bacterium]
MRIFETILFLIFAYFLISIFWPFLVVLLIIVIYQIFKMRRLFKQSVQEAAPNESNQNYETFSQDGSSDVIDADYTERSPSDGSK